MLPNPKKRNAWIAGGLILLVLVIGAVGTIIASKSDSSETVTLFREGDVLPAELALVDLDGKTTTLADYKGKVLLINFWAGWCGPCLQEMPSIARLYQKLSPRGLMVLAPSMDDIPQHGINVLKRVLPEIPFPVFYGLRSGLSSRFSLDALPYTIVLDKELRVKFSRAGAVDWNSPEAQRLIEGLL